MGAPITRKKGAYTTDRCRLEGSRREGSEHALLATAAAMGPDLRDEEGGVGVRP